MFIDTHCHINMMINKEFDTPLSSSQLKQASDIIHAAHDANVQYIINVGTSVIESKNCIALAQEYKTIYAAIGVHPNDCTDDWRNDIHELELMLKKDDGNIIVAIGECGLDHHYPDYNIQRQKDAFKAQIELALSYDKALIVHTRDARDETLYSLEEFKDDITRGIIHCFSEDYAFAQTVISWGFSLGVGGTLTYPRNNSLRDSIQKTSLSRIVLETDAPFLPPQTMRGKQNNPAQIATIASFLANLTEKTVDDIAQQTTANAVRIFNLEECVK